MRSEIKTPDHDKEAEDRKNNREENKRKQQKNART